MSTAPLTLISGGSRGLGLALVEHLLARGDAVATFSRSGSAALSALAKAHPGRLVTEPLDITDSAAIGGFIARVADRFGRLDHCIANAAIAHEGVLATMRDDEIDAMLAVNLRGAIVLIRECVRQMLAAPAVGPVPDRSITVVSSVVAENGSPGLSVYAATKRSAELLSHTYAHLFAIPQTGLRFFTVYGPWGRPDMAAFIFTRKILAGEPIDVFNNGDMRRDFTYIDDITAGVVAALDRPPAGPGVPLRLYNLGNSRVEPLMRFIEILQDALGKKADIRFGPMQAGDVQATSADIGPAMQDLGFAPRTSIAEGLPRFVGWYRSYYGA